MDGTLLDSEPIAVKALSACLSEQGITSPIDLHESVIGRSADGVHAWLVREHGLALDFVAWEKRRHHHYMSLAGRLTGFEPSIKMWRVLEANGILQAVVSNSDRAIVDVNLRAAGLARPGLVTVSRNDLRRGKPDPEGYLRAAWLLRVDPDECVIIEDSLAGASAGIASGMMTMFVPHATVPAPMGVTWLKQMEDLLEIIGS